MTVSGIQIGKTISLLFFTLQVLSIYAGHDEINLHHVREFDFFPCKNLMERDTAAPFAKKSFPFLFLFF